MNRSSDGRGAQALAKPVMLIAPVLVAAAFAATVVAAPESRRGPPRDAHPVRHAGVNLAGGEFNSGKRPGKYGKDYVYPDAKTAAPFRVMGMNTVRLPIRWERVQREPFGPLSKVEMDRIDKTIDHLGGFGMVVLDVHNYATYAGKRLDRVERGGAMLADLWRRLAEHYRGSRKVAFGMMNEPNGIGAREWRAIADQSMKAIRATGARNLVLVPGTRWSGAHSWRAGGPGSNANAFAGFRDPGRNFAFDLHQYLDADSSGTKWECVDPGAAARRLAAATTWLRENRYRGFLGEFGAAANPDCLAALDSLLDTVDRNSDVWIGWTYWAGGPWWGKYPMSVQPAKGQPKPQAAVLARHLPRAGGRAK